MENTDNRQHCVAGSEKIYVPGKIFDIKVGMRKINLTDTVTISENGDRIVEKNRPVVVYDTGGVFTDEKCKYDINEGIPRIREKWIAERGDTERLAEISSECRTRRYGTACRNKFGIRQEKTWGQVARRDTF